MLYNVKGVVPEGEYVVPLGKGISNGSGSDVTIVAHVLLMVHHALKAAETLSPAGHRGRGH